MGTPQLAGFDGGFQVPVTLDPTTGLDTLIVNGSFGVVSQPLSSSVTLAAGAIGPDGWRAGSGGCTYGFVLSGPDATLTITAGTLEQVVEASKVVGGTYTANVAGSAQGGIGINGGGPASYQAFPTTVTGATAGQTIRLVLSTGSGVAFASLLPGGIARAATAAAFQRRNERVLCKRYYRRLSPSSVNSGFGQASTVASTQATMVVRFDPVDLAREPAFAAGGSFSLIGTNTVQVPASAITLGTNGVQGVTLNIAATGLVAGQSYTLAANNDTTAFLEFRADVP